MTSQLTIATTCVVCVLLMLICHCQSSATSFLASQASATSARATSMWYSPPSDQANASYFMDVVEKQGGNKLVTSLFLYCGDSIAENGSFVPSDFQRCNYTALRLRQMGIGSEIVVGGSLDGMRQAFANPDASLAAIADTVKRRQLYGVSWDLEPDNSTAKDCEDFASYLRLLRQHVNPLGARVTTYSNSFNPIIECVHTLAAASDRVLGGETYNGKTFSEWLDNYHKLISDASNITKVSPGLLASTERGDWNCESSSMQQRLKQMQSDHLVEMSVFSLSHLNSTSSCADTWFPFMRQFLQP